jgi:hypothetical protein
MAQLIAFFGTPGSPGMPHVPGFQFWATRGLNNTTFAPQPAPAFKPPSSMEGFRFVFVIAVANTAHAIVGALVTLTIAETTVVTFEFTETTAAPGNIAVVVSNGDTAAQCATALINAINTWATANMPLALAAAPATEFGFGTDTVAILTLDPSIPILVATSGPPVLARTGSNAAPYGDALLHRAWRTFVYQGVDPALVSVFPIVDGIPPDIAIPFWPLHPLARKAFPQQFVNPWANSKSER